MAKMGAKEDHAKRARRQFTDEFKAGAVRCLQCLTPRVMRSRACSRTLPNSSNTYNNNVSAIRRHSRTASRSSVWFGARISVALDDSHSSARRFASWLRTRFELRFLDEYLDDITSNVDANLDYLFGHRHLGG